MKIALIAALAVFVIGITLAYFVKMFDEWTRPLIKVATYIVAFAIIAYPIETNYPSSFEAQLIQADDHGNKLYRNIDDGTYFIITENEWDYFNPCTKYNIDQEMANHFVETLNVDFSDMIVSN